MDFPSILCSACCNIFQGPPENYDLQLHHPDFESFSNAVRSKCYICNVLWDRHRFQDGSDIPNDFAWLGYEWNQGADELEVEDMSPSFTIHIFETGNPQWARRYTWFCLFPCEGVALARKFLYPLC
jgi:hypothetical protein